MRTIYSPKGQSSPSGSRLFRALLTVLDDNWCSLWCGLDHFYIKSTMSSSLDVISIDVMAYQSISLIMCLPELVSWTSAFWAVGEQFDPCCKHTYHPEWEKAFSHSLFDTHKSGWSYRDLLKHSNNNETFEYKSVCILKDMAFPVFIHL